MPTRKKYHVVPSPGGWKVKRQGGSRATSVHDTQAEAIAAARTRATSGPQGQVIVHRPSGQIRCEYTYGNDPFPPKG